MDLGKGQTPREQNPQAQITTLPPHRAANQPGVDQNGVDQTVVDQAKDLVFQGKLSQAEALLNDFVISESAPDQKLRAYSFLIRIAIETHHNEKISTFAEQIKKIPVDTNESKIHYGQCICSIAQGWFVSHDYAKATTYFQKAIILSEETQSVSLELRARIGIAEVYRTQSNFKQAGIILENLKSRIDLNSLILSDRAAVTEFYILLGNVHRKIGHYNDAIQSFEQARALIENKNSPQFHYLLWAFGTCYAALEDKEKAKIYLELASSTQTGAEFFRINVLSKLTLAKLLTTVGEYDAADKVFQEIQALVGNDEETYFGKRLLGGRALLFIKKGEYAEANEVIDRLVVYAAKSNELKELMRLRLLKAETQLRSGDPAAQDEARSMLEEALAYYREQNVPRHQAVCLDILARLDSCSGYPQDALKKTTEMIELAHKGSFDRLALRGELARLVLERKLGQSIAPDRINALFREVNKIHALAEKVILSRFISSSYDEWTAQLSRLSHHDQRYVNEFFDDFHFVPNQSTDLEIDSNSHYVREKHLGEIPFHNKFTLMKILLLLAQSPGREYSKEELANQIWEQDYNPLRHDNNIYININRLRKLIEPNPRESRYVMNGSRGYYFNPEMRVNISTKIAQTAPRNTANPSPSAISLKETSRIEPEVNS